MSDRDVAETFLSITGSIGHLLEPISAAYGPGESGSVQRVRHIEPGHPA